MQPHEPSRILIGLGIAAAVATGAFGNQALRAPPAPVVVVASTHRPQAVRLPPRRELPRSLRRPRLEPKAPVAKRHAQARNKSRPRKR